MNRIMTNKQIRRGFGLGLAGLALICIAAAAQDQQILKETGVTGGLVVHVGCGDGKLTAALWAGEAFVVQGLDADVTEARKNIQAAGVYGPVSATEWRGGALPYVDNLVNLIVVSGDANRVAKDELLRVLAPGGTAVFLNPQSTIEKPKLVKPWPKDIDEWTHYLHDADNNAVSHDALVGPPRRLQWVSDPRWARHHDHIASLTAMVSANGRVFSIEDEGSLASILLPSRWVLVARDAFNGVPLWKREMNEWITALWPLKAGPSQLPRRLVAVGNRVYVTLGIDAPVTALDAVTGKTLLTYAGTEHTDEILFRDGILYCLARKAPNRSNDFRPISTFVWQNPRHANSAYAWAGTPQLIVVCDAETGTVRWKKETAVAPLTMAIDRDRLFFHNGQCVVALDNKTGADLWTSEPMIRKSFPTGYGPTLVVQQGVVLISVDQPSMTALSAADGKTLWTSPKHPGGHFSPDDMLVIGGVVWSCETAGKGSNLTTGRDLKTGEIKSEFPCDAHASWFHHRCYRSRATDKYFIASRTGLEFIDLEKQHWDYHHWVRGGCLYGFMPANGLLYVPPQACACFMESKLFGFNALAAEQPARQATPAVAEGERLERGPAYGEPVSAAAQPDEWPTYRHDAERSGSAKTVVPAELKPLWRTKLSGRLSSVVVSGGKVFLAAVDAHTVHALDLNTGNTVWSHTVGGRVDSPPTIHDGRVLFGSADGWVYCLKAADGRLIWRFRAAPADRCIMARGQLESAWPVSGSVLVFNDVVHGIAGRSAFLDGGMRLFRLEPNTGRLLSETIMDDRDPESGANLQGRMRQQDMPVALPDILSCDGTSIYMRSQAFDLEGKRRGVDPMTAFGGGTPQVKNHIFSRTGFLDDTWFWRSYWILGKNVSGNFNSWMKPGHYAPCGRLLVMDETNVYGFGRRPEYLRNASVAKYFFYRAEREVKGESVRRVQSVKVKGAGHADWALYKNIPLQDQHVATFLWTQDQQPIRACALVLTRAVLFAAGPPDIADEEKAWSNPDDATVRAQLDAQNRALAGQKGAQLLAFSTADGKRLAILDLDAMPVFDGLAAAGGKLLLSLADGSVLCLGNGEMK